MPVELVSSGINAFDLTDLSHPNSSVANLTKIAKGQYRFDLIPDNNASSVNLFVEVNGSGMRTSGFSDLFEDANFTYFYNPKSPVISSALFSHWARGEPSTFSIQAKDANIVTVSQLPAALEYNSTTRTISGLSLIHI